MNRFILWSCCMIGVFFLVSCNEQKERDISEVLANKQRKEPSPQTLAYQDSIKAYLNISDPEDSINAHRGFIGSLDYNEIKDDSDKTVYDLAKYDFLLGDAATSVNPSLWRQSKYNRLHGLFEVKKDAIYQIRGFDLANMSIVKTNEDHKWIVIDPLGSPPTAKAGLQLFKDSIDTDMEVVAVIFTHSHIDHFGGIRGVSEDFRDIDIIAPEGFFEESVSENVMAGNCMGRRASYMYGNLLRKDSKGTVGTGLGQTTSTGEAGILKETITISGEGVTKDTIHGLEIEFIYTPESEAPAEMMFYFPTYQAFCQAEDLNHTLHNLYTLRGAKVRNGQKWSKYIDKAIQLWGDKTTTSFGSHHWPTWGADTILSYWEGQRDLYRFIHDQTLRLANRGYTPKELAEMIQLPAALDTKFYNRGYYGSVSHDVKAQYQLYFGWFDGNPANLNPLPPSEAGAKYVEFMGGVDSVYAKAKRSFLNGEYRWAAEVLNHLVFSEPENDTARYLLADTYEQMGYQAESGPWRNFYLSGAFELREGVLKLPTPSTATPDIVAGMPNELYFDFLAMKFKGLNDTASVMDFRFNIELTDLTGEDNKVALIVHNGAVTPRFGSNSHVPQADQTAYLKVERDDLNLYTLGKINYDELKGRITFTGDEQAFDDFMDQIDSPPFWFNIVTP